MAEELHLSGVLGDRVAAGIYSGWYAHTALDAGTRLSAVAFWRVMVLGLEALLFVLLGLQAPQLAEELDVAPLAGQAVVVALAVVGVRMAWAFLPQAGLRRRLAGARRGRLGGHARRDLARRGALRPARRRGAPGDPPDHLRRDLRHPLGQGLTLRRCCARSTCPEERWSPDEATPGWRPRSRRSTGSRSSRTRARLASRCAACASSTAARFALCVAVLGGGEPPEDGRRELKEYGAMRRELIAAERRALIGLRNEGRIRNELVRRIERDLDLDEARIRPQ